MRASGVLLPVASLPSGFGIGDLGPGAYRFADFLSASRQRFWQILPLNPTTSVHNHSPYSSFSAFAGNPLLISLQLLLEEGYIDNLYKNIGIEEGRINYEFASCLKLKLLRKAFKKVLRTGLNQEIFQRFCLEHSSWLEDFALFSALKFYFNRDCWSKWPEELRYRHPEALAVWRRKLSHEIEEQKFFQFIFFTQWHALKNYCNQRNIRIIGDIPIYVDYDSVDVWSNPHLFKLDDNLSPLYVAGVPPDYFSKTGQRWGNPVYDWKKMRETGYSWWFKRFEHNLRLFDMIRIDHFRGFVAYWEIPAEEKTAVQGRWVKVPAEDFLAALTECFKGLPIIVEDLGFITDDVREIIERFKLPGMKVLLFAFADDFPHSSYLPHNYPRNCVVYTGTHDTSTCRGWFEMEASKKMRDRVFRYLGRKISADEIAWEFVRLAFMSVANLAIIPLQDLLGLGGEARINRPATRQGNWCWQLRSKSLTPALEERLSEITHIYGRSRFKINPSVREQWGRK